MSLGCLTKITTPPQTLLFILLSSMSVLLIQINVCGRRARGVLFVLSQVRGGVFVCEKAVCAQTKGRMSVSG